MKGRSSKFSKRAWPSRVTAPVIKVDLTIQCKNLPKKDLLSQADAFCVLWQVPNGYNPNFVKGMPSKLPGRQEIEKGQTSPIRASVEPKFKDAFRLEYTFHEEQTYIIRVYDEDLRFATDLKEHDYLGGCLFTLGQLMGAKGCSLAKRLADEKSYMVITGNGKCYCLSCFSVVCQYIGFLKEPYWNTWNISNSFFDFATLMLPTNAARSRNY